jgi:hypothetical protein
MYKYIVRATLVLSYTRERCESSAGNLRVTGCSINTDTNLRRVRIQESLGRDKRIAHE